MAESAKEFFDNLQAQINPEKIKGINATYQWDITDAGKWYAVLSDDGATVSEGEADDSNITISVSEENWLAIVAGTLAPQMAFLTGKIKIKGDMSLAMKLQNLMG
jgi:putative sterol carrier protein